MLAFGPPISRGSAAFRGLLAAAVGLACVIWPGITIGVVVALFAIYSFVDAGVLLVRLFNAGDTAGQRVLMVVVAFIDVAAGLVAIVYPGITAAVLVIVIGVWAIFGGLVELAAAWQLSVPGSGWLAFGGVLSVTAGIVLVVWPAIGAFSLALVFGVYLIAYGVALLASAIATPVGRDVGGRALA
jgi:uncharacterized membrane protein HdeD (DUF308 family)